MADESAEHRAWRDERDRRWEWESDYTAALARLIGVVAEKGHREELAAEHADHMQEIRLRFRNSTKSEKETEPAFYVATEELPGAVGGNPSDFFARRPAFNPHT
jgi:hypothetical protein